MAVVYEAFLSSMACRGSGVRVSLAPLIEYPFTDRDFRGLHWPLFNAKRLNITFDAQNDAQNFG